MKGGFSMKDLQHKIAYLQGQAEGMNLADSAGGKAMAKMLEDLEEVAD